MRKSIFVFCFFVLAIAGKAQIAVNYYYDGHTIGLSTNPEKSKWFELRVNTVSYNFSGWQYSDRGITQAYFCFRLFSDPKASLYSGVGVGVPLLSSEVNWATVNIPVGIQINPFNQLPKLFLTAEYNPMIGVTGDFEITNALSVGFRYVFQKKK